MRYGRRSYGYSYEGPAIEVHRQFESWSEFVASACDDSLLEWKHRRSSHAIDNNDHNPWHGTESWEEAVDMATRTGWPEGRKMLSDSLAVVRPMPEPFRSIELSIAGAWPLVPAYCAGSPECMIIDPGSDLRHARPVIRIDYNHWISAYVQPRDMMLRGAAVLSLAETLERKGYSTELRIIGNTTTYDIFRYSVVYKKAGSDLDIDRAAFAIAHPSSLRRLGFAILEQHGPLERSLRDGYGTPMHQSNDPDPNTIFVPGSRGNETPDTARRAVELAAEKVLGPVLEAEETGSD